MLRSIRNNDTESGNVSLTLSGVDGDAASVTVTLTDSEGTETTATASDGNNGTWTVDVSNDALKDGNISVAVAVTDDAGNTASASTGFELDTVGASVVSFATTHASGDHIKAGETVAITATMSEAVQAGGQITVNLSSGGSAVLTADEEGTTLSGTHCAGERKRGHLVGDRYRSGRFRAPGCSR